MKKKYVEIQFFRKQNSVFFLVQMFYNPMGYLASIYNVLNAPLIFLISIEEP